jgi:hypothetical protein
VEPIATNESISTAEAVAVIVGAVPAENFTPVKVAVVIPVAAWVIFRIKLLPEVAVGIVNVQGVEAVRVAVCTVPLVSDSVLEAPTVPIATTDSV